MESEPWMKYISASSLAVSLFLKLFSQEIRSLQIAFPGFVIRSMYSIEVNVFYLFDSWISKCKIIHQHLHCVSQASLICLFIENGRIDNQCFFMFEQRNPTFQV